MGSSGHNAVSFIFERFQGCLRIFFQVIIPVNVDPFIGTEGDIGTDAVLVLIFDDMDVLYAETFA